MNDRVQSALRALGIGAPPAQSLEREGAFFALLEDTLIYQDEGGTRRVTLRDLNRIHSDQEGMLRVETPAGTALTASLVGYDPARVQAFFAGVRDATARAKHLPTSPLPGVGGQKTFGSSSPAPTPPKREVPAPPVTPTPAPTEIRAAPPRTEKVPDGAPQPGPEAPKPEAGKTKEAEKRAGRDRPAPTQWKPSTSGDLGGETVRVIGPASSVGTVTPAVPSAPTTPTASAPEPAPPAPSTSSSARFIPSQSAPPTKSAPVTPPPVTVAPTPVPVEDVPAAPSLTVRTVNRTQQMLARGGLAGLDARAEGVLGWVGRLRVLAAVLGLAGLGLAVFQFTDGAGLAGLWTLIVGGIGALALLAFAEVTGLVVALARAVAVGVGATAEADEAGVDPDA